MGELSSPPSGVVEIYEFCSVPIAMSS